MIADDGITPILMDFGSATKARIPITNNTVALQQQVRQLAPLSCEPF
jgi:serine/threonine kinase 16